MSNCTCLAGLAQETVRHPLVFITKYGQSWAKQTKDSPVTKETAKLLARLKLHRRGRGFYALRHTFQTIGDGARYPIATRYIMGRGTEQRYVRRVQGNDSRRAPPEGGGLRPRVAFWFQGAARRVYTFVQPVSSLL